VVSQGVAINIVPWDGEPGANTWGTESAARKNGLIHQRGSPNAYNTAAEMSGFQMTFDEENNLLYVLGGNAARCCRTACSFAVTAQEFNHKNLIKCRVIDNERKMLPKTSRPRQRQRPQLRTKLQHVSQDWSFVELTVIRHQSWYFDTRPAGR
jgi:hypothetical protein